MSYKTDEKGNLVRAKGAANIYKGLMLWAIHEKATDELAVITDPDGTKVVTLAQCVEFALDVHLELEREKEAAKVKL